MSNWIKPTLLPLNAENFELVLNFKAPGILVPGFITRETCDLVARRLGQNAFRSYAHLNNIPVQQLGLCHNQFAHEDKSVYFAKRQEAQSAVDKIYEGLGLNPVDQVVKALIAGTGLPVAIFDEPGYGNYFAGAFRRFKGHGRLHVDHAPSHIRKPWAVTEIQRQLTWNIYYTLAGEGGELVIYDTVHTPDKDQMKVPGEYYFPYEVLDSNERVVVRPSAGDLIIFNTQNFHEILGRPDGDRISQTSFIGQRKDRSLGLWS